MEPSQLTDLLNAAVAGNKQAEELIVSHVYQELRRHARALGAEDRIDPTLLVNEIWLRIFRSQGSMHFENRRSFFVYFSVAMRNLLVDYLRRSEREQIGGVEQLLASVESKAKVSFLDLHNALSSLEGKSPRLAQVVQLRFFGGLTMEEIAEELQVSLSTVEQDWRLARAVLRVQLRQDFQ